MNFTKSSLYMKAYVEILEIIKKIDVEHKVPSKLIDFFEKNKDLNYEFKLKNMDLKNQVLRETVIILAVLEQKYWANDNERKVLNKILEENEKKHQKEIREKYNSDKIFENSQKNIIKNDINKNTKTSLYEVKESIFVKIKKWFKNLFKQN